MKEIIKLLQESLEKLEEKHNFAVLSGRKLLLDYANTQEVQRLNEVEVSLHNEQNIAYHTSKAISKIKKQIIRLDKL